jgi:hypothetical protein
MPQATSVPIKIAVLALLTINSGFTKETNSCDGLSPEKQNRIAQSDSAKKYIIAEYCFSFDTDRGWKLLLYEQIVPLTIKIQTESQHYDYSMYANLEANIKFTATPVGSSNSCIGTSSNPNKKTYKCKLDRNVEYNIYERFNTLYSIQKIDTAQIAVLFDKVFPVEWNLEFKIDYQPHNLSGSYNIKISGICNEEQLKKNRSIGMPLI